MDSIVGVLPQTWYKLLRENNFKISPSYGAKAMFISLLSLRNNIYQKREYKLFAQKIAETRIKQSPVFILGHWRSGTTFLHNLLSRDTQFAYPRRFEVRNPHTFLYIGQKFEKMIRDQKAQKRPMDNIQNSLLSPAEDEFALAAMMPYSPLLGWAFPKNQAYYESFSDFKSSSKAIIDTWKKCYLHFLKKLTFKYEKQLLLKSPLNTGRIKLLSEMFPDSKFIHIHRNPYRVYQSTEKLYRTAIASSALQKFNMDKELSRRIIERYARMYDAYAQQASAIPEGQICEISYEALERDPYSVISGLYTCLKLDGFEAYAPILKKASETAKKYKKNTYTVLEQNLKEEIYQATQKYFDLWGYSQ